jgi:hypothetical protein
MLKKTLYPKTKRIGGGATAVISEKLDGSNIGLFKFKGELYIAQRNYIYKAADAFTDETTKQGVYNGLYGFLEENLSTLEEALNETSCIFCEWIGMGKIKYPHLNKRLYMFAKANVTGDTLEELELKNTYYYPDLFKWCFANQEMHPLVDPVPVVELMDTYPTVAYLDTLYDEYNQAGGYEAEGFVILCNGSITKYVRKKNGKPTPHTS